MQPKRLKIIGLGLITALLLLVFGNMDRLPFTNIPAESAIAQQTTPTPTPTPTPDPHQNPLRHPPQNLHHRRRNPQILWNHYP
ncbi:hypothetical protein [Limnospira platensis]|uniref:hypothetical protein n=1 Tax=Limnospira platensis TaxID=118562 RepID=UPI002570C367